MTELMEKLIDKPKETENGKILNKSYPEKKVRKISEVEKQSIREDIRKGETDIYKLANKYNCSSSQIAGIKADMHRMLMHST